MQSMHYAIRAVPDEIDRLAGTWEEDPDFDRAVAEFERIDDESWT